MATEEDVDYTKLSLEDRLRHTVWKARKSGYEDAVKKFAMMDPTDKEFSQFLGLVKGFVSDSNAVAQEKGLEAAVAFVENAKVAGKTAGDVCSATIQKCLGAPKVKTKEKGQELLLLYIEIEKQETVIEELLTGLTNKNPKVKAGCVQTLNRAVNQFGIKVFGVKKVVQQIPGLLEEKDKNVREEAKALTVELYRWIGPAMTPQLQSLKPVQLQELKTEFDSLPGTKPSPSRFLRSQQERLAQMEEASGSHPSAGSGNGAEETGEDGGNDAVDPWEFLEVVDIIGKLSKELKSFNELVVSKKWAERKQALDDLYKELENKKPEPSSNYGDLVFVLKNIVAKDANINVVSVAAKLLAALALGLRKKFGTYALMCAPVILEKFKEKKLIVRDALREAIDAIAQTTSLESLSEEIVKTLDNKNPLVKAETALFLSRVFARCTTASLPKKLLKIFCASLVQTINDQDGTVREAGMEALGAAMRVVSEKNISPFLTDVDSLKMEKIKEFAGKAAPTGPGPSVSSASVPAQAGALKSAAVNTKSKPGAETSQKAEQSADTNVASTSGPKKTVGAAPSKSQGTKKAVLKKAPGPTPAGKTDLGEEKELSNEEVDSEGERLFSSIQLQVDGSEEPVELLKANESPQYKERLAAINKIMEIITTMNASDIKAQAIAKLVNKGKKLSILSVVKAKIELYKWLAENCSFSAQCFNVCLPEIVEKIHEKKDNLGELCMNTLAACAEALSLSHVANKALEHAFDQQKNPKCQAETFVWLGKAIQDFGLRSLDTKAVVERVKKGLAATNPDVRYKAIYVAGLLYWYVGNPVKMLFEDEKPQVKEQIDEEAKKYDGQKPPAPTRGLKQTSTVREASEGAGVAEENADEEDQALSVADLVDRKDIGPEITDQLLEELSDANWKIRKEALDKVQLIIQDAKFIKPNLGGLPETLKARLCDANKNLVNISLDIASMLATAIGPRVKEHIRVIIPGVFSVLADSKPLVRKKAVDVLDKWVGECGLKSFLDGEIVADALKSDNPNLRSELLNWLSNNITKHSKKLPDGDIKICVPILYTALENRSPDVRKAAQEATLPFLTVCGYDFMQKALSKLKPGSQSAVQPVLEKARATLQTAAAPVEKASGEPGGKTQDPKGEPKGSRAGSVSKGATGKKGGDVTVNNSAKKKDQDEGCALLETNQKQQRFSDENKMRILKWQFAQPKPEYIDLLKEQLSPCCKPALISQLFSIDFKQHLKAIECLAQCLESGPTATIGALDLILKWTTLRFFDTNPSVLLKCLDYLQKLFQLCIDEDYRLHDIEANCFIPFLLLKSGDSKDVVRGHVKKILTQLCLTYPAGKLFPLVLDGIKSKNARQRVECLDFIGYLIETTGVEVCQPTVPEALRKIAHQIGDKDNAVRNAALNAVFIVYMYIGEKIYKHIGTSISEKDLSLLQERIKRSSKNRPLVKKAPVDTQKTPKINADVAKTPVTPRGEQNGMPPMVNGDTVTKIPKPKRGMFQLDEDYIGPSPVEPGDFEPLDLFDLTDVYKMMDEPVNVYVPKSRYLYAQRKLLTSSQAMDASTTLDTVITQIASTNIDTSIQALVQIDELLKDLGKFQLLVGHIDQLLQAIFFQYRMAYNKHMGDATVDKEHVVALYRNLCMALLSLVNQPDLVKEATEGPLRDLIYNLITVLLDQRLNGIQDGPQVIRSINVMIVKLVERANPTSCFVALIKLLVDCVKSETCSTTFQELVMKCIWKMSRLLEQNVHDIELDKVLLEMHVFMTAFPAAFWKDRTDTPLRTIKTILHSLVKILGAAVLQYTNLIPDHDNSEVVRYLHKAIKQRNNKHLSTTGSMCASSIDNMSTSSRGTTESKDSEKASSVPPSYDQDKKVIMEIFKKIGSKDLTKQGLEDLYDFTQSHPQIDLSPYLLKASDFFKSYVEKGLRNVAEERQSKENRRYNPQSQVPGAFDELSDPDALMERLKKYRQQYRVDKSNVDSKDGINPNIDYTSERWQKVIEYKKRMGEDVSKYEKSLKRSNSETSSDVELNVGSRINEIAHSNDSNEILNAPKTPTPIQPKELEDLRSRLDKVKSMSTSKSPSRRRP